MELVFVIVIIFVAIFLSNISSGFGGAKGLVRIMFYEYDKTNKKILVEEAFQFATEEQAKAFVLNLIFFKRINQKELESSRCKLELETHGKLERFEYKYNGKNNWAELYNFQDLGDLICTIWYIESGLRSSWYYGEFNGRLDFDFYDKYSSQVITKEYLEQCKVYGINL